MKKTNKSPENVEVTPSKKKLKQARLPFMLISDVSPKAESQPSRKRKLSAQEPEPVTKMGKITKENNISEDLVVISDEDCKTVPSPVKEDKPHNPFVKLVDTAWKKKLQKAKGPKKPKTRSKKQKVSSTKQNSVDSSDNNEDIEMVEVDVIIHENGDGKNEDNADQSHECKEGSPVEEANLDNNNKSQTKEKEPEKNTKSNRASTKPSENKTDSESSEEVKENKSTLGKETNEVVCLDDSNNSSDVVLPQSNKTNDSKTTPNDAKQSNTKNKSKQTRKTITPKRSSTRNKTVAKTDNQDKDIKQDIVKAKPENTDKSKDNSPKKSTSKANDTKASIESDKETENSDIEMVDITEDQSTKTTSPKESDQTKKIEENKQDSKTTDVLTTPKRSIRNKTKTDEADNLNESSTSLLDESMASNMSTPKHNKSLSDGQADKSLNDSTRSVNLTPKQLQRKMEFAKKREEKEKEKQEREKKRQQEKEERAKQKLEKEEQKKKEREEKEEAKRKEREEKEEQKKKEREEKEKQREWEKKLREMKEEQKRKEKEDKEEQRRKEKEAREEERRKKQEAMELEKQEQELKKKKAAEAFVNFFVPKQKVEREASTGPVSKNNMLSSFTIKADMRLAPTCRVDLSDEKREVLDKCLEEQNSSDDLYLKCLKNGVKPLCSGKTWPLDDRDDEVMIVEDELPPIDGASEVITCESAPREKLRPKLFSFHENRRPPYWGTWRKKSAFIKPRRPFGQDEKQLEYEVDSDDDWEDEQDGESLDGSAGGSDDEAGADDYEVDNEVFVPHGYLSDEEATMDEDDVLSLSPETQKARLKHLEDEFESEMKKPTEKLKPRLYGLLWETEDGGKPEKCVDALWNYFQKFAMIMDDPTPLLQPIVEPETTASEKKKTKKKKVVTEGETNEQSPKSEKKKKQKQEPKESKKPKPEVKKPVPNQPGINTFLKRVKPTQL